jgi:hypothetical protein
MNETTLQRERQMKIWPTRRMSSTGSHETNSLRRKEMQNHRMFDVHEICNIDDVCQMTVAIKRESDTDNAPSESDNVVRLPRSENSFSEKIGRAPIRSSNVIFDSRILGNEAETCVKTRRLRAHWEHIEGVGLRCTWVEIPDDESGHESAAKADSRADTEPDSGTNAE